MFSAVCSYYRCCGAKHAPLAQMHISRTNYLRAPDPFTFCFFVVNINILCTVAAATVFTGNWFSPLTARGDFNLSKKNTRKIFPAKRSSFPLVLLWAANFCPQTLNGRCDLPVKPRNWRSYHGLERNNMLIIHDVFPLFATKSLKRVEPNDVTLKRSVRRIFGSSLSLSPSGEMKSEAETMAFALSKLQD